MRSKDRSSSRGPPSNGSATASVYSRTPRKPISLARSVPDSHGIYMVPAFVGLGAPHWDPDARGAIFGLTLGAASKAHLARAALEAVAYQSLDLLEAWSLRTSPAVPPACAIDGGMAANDWLCQFLADILRVPVERPQNIETTALGAAFLAGLATGVWSGLDEIAADLGIAGYL